MQAHLEDIKKAFQYSTETVLGVRDSLVSEMEEGLCANSSSSLAMIPTYVCSIPTGAEKGVAYALDIGGSNLRALKVNLEGDGIITSPEAQVLKKEIPVEVQRGEHEDSLFDFLAEAVAELTKEGKLGFTFSFPVDQKSLTSGILIRWTKNFTVPGVVGRDVCDLLNKAFDKFGVNVHVTALISDTVGTLLSGAYQAKRIGVPDNGNVFAGLILGTGTNVCYWEQVKNIKKLNREGDEGGMIINAESGNFGSRSGFVGKHLPMNEFDHDLDEHSPNTGGQLLEKQISGMYLGEVWRLVMWKYISNGSLFTSLDKSSTTLSKPFGVDTAPLSTIEADNSEDLKDTEKVLSSLGVKDSSLEERRFVKDVCHLVAVRAARLSAMLICALLKHCGLEQEASTIPVCAVDGSVFEKFPRFPEMMTEGVIELTGREAVKFVLAKEGSGYGAALASII